ncbi:MAG TPA: amidase [Thermoleophilaceae bacterium]|nr:amidase [Thermoleophilaceae bacterium]
MPDELMFKSATEQAALVRSGELSSRELVEASLAAIDRMNEELNAVVTRCDERALSEADAVAAGDDRPLAGVPLLVKDLAAITEGVRTTMGMRAMGDWVPSEDSATVRRLRDAGAIVVGKTNLPEMGILPVSEPLRFGPARNPWDTSRTPGGSSGGSAAGVAAGMVAIAHGNDGGGSIRIPASCCGLVGLKPSRGRVSWGPHLAELAAGFATDGVLSRSVRDSALGLDLLAGYEPGDPYWTPDPSAPFVDAVEREPGKLRVAFVVDSPNGVPVDPECVAATRHAAELLSSLGHSVEEVEIESDEAYVTNFVTVWIAGTANEVETWGRISGQQLDVEQLEPLSRQMYDMSMQLSATDYLRALDWLHDYSRKLVAMWGGIDVLLTPTLAKPPIEIGALQPAEGEPPIQMLMNSATWVPFTPVWNVTGQPAVSLPLHQTPDGLPVGVQLVGPPAGEELLISLSAQLEAAEPWSDRRPALAVA